jgi:hypothetical protein
LAVAQPLYPAPGETHGELARERLALLLVFNLTFIFRATFGLSLLSTDILIAINLSARGGHAYGWEKRNLHTGRWSAAFAGGDRPGID